MQLSVKVERYAHDSESDLVSPKGFWFRAGNVRDVTVESVSYYCDEMKEAWDDEFIGLGGFDSCLNKDRNVNIYHCSPYPEGAAWCAMPINYCPFCGAEIAIAEVEATTQFTQRDNSQPPR